MPNTPLSLGFQDRIHDSQTTFRALLDSLARPGKVNQITASLTPPNSLTPACAAACLTLLDLETLVWLHSDFKPEVKAWLLFHAGCRFSKNCQEANFAIIRDAKTMPDLSVFCQGTPEVPEVSTTLLIQVKSFQDGEAVTLKGPGIFGETPISLSCVPKTFWQQWQQNTASYPLGVDLYFFTNNAVIGLPRTAQPVLFEL